MNKFLALATAGVLIGVLAFSSNVYAQIGLDVGGGASGSADGSGASVSADTSVSVDANSPDDDGAPDQGSGDAGVAVGGSSFTLTQKDAAAASLDAESAELGSASVSTSADLSAYATAQMKRDADIQSIDVASDHVSVAYRADARFLGFIPANLKATATVDAEGNVDIDYPWYRFLFAVKGASDAEATLEARVQEIMASAGGSLSATAQAQLIEAMHLALSGGATVNAGAGTTADMGGTGIDATGSVSGDTAGSASVDDDGTPDQGSGDVDLSY